MGKLTEDPKIAVNDLPFDRGMDPIIQKHRGNMQVIMGVLTEMFPDVGLCLFVFDEQANQPRANYISNTDRRQTLLAIKEWVARQEVAGL